MHDMQNFTSLPPHEEAQFVVFERTTQEGLHKAFVIALATSIGIAVFALILFFGFAPPEKEKKHEDAKGQVKKAAPAEAAAPTK